MRDWLSAEPCILFPCGHSKVANFYITNGILVCPECNRVWMVEDSRFTYEMTTYENYPQFSEGGWLDPNRR